MEIRQLRYFEAVARTLNFSRAAERLHIAQPPLSRQIQQLEEELGVLLLDRSSRPIRLTNAGSFFYDQAVQILARLKEVEVATRRIGAGGSLWMGIGFVPSALYGYLPAVVRQFCQEHEHIEVSLLELTSVQQAEALNSGRIEVGIGRLAISDPRLENSLLSEEPLIAAVPAHGPLGRETLIPLSRLVEETLITFPATPRPSFADQVLKQFNVRGHEPRRIYETNGLQTALGLVAAGMGVTIVPETVRRLQREDVAYCALADTGLTTPLIMTVRKGDIAPHVAVFCDAIRRAVTLDRERRTNAEGANTEKV